MERTSRCTTKIIHKIWTTISHFNVCWPFTAAWCLERTHLPADLTVCYSGVNSINPGGCVGITPVIRWTRSWYFCASGPLKTEPSRSNSIVTGMVVIWVRYLSVSCIETHVVLAFCSQKKNNRPFYSCGLSTLSFGWMAVRLRLTLFLIQTSFQFFF